MKRILMQLDTDSHPSSFDGVVAVDAGVDQLFQYSGIDTENVTGLVHGAMFTRGGDDLKNSALFVGGSNVSAGEAVFKTVTKTFFGPVRVSVMLDSNGSNTTAAAAVIAAGRHLDLSKTTALVLGGTGPVGQRAVQLLASEGANVRVGSRSHGRAADVCKQIQELGKDSELTPTEIGNETDLAATCEGVGLIIAAGAAGVELLPEAQRQAAKSLEVAIDLNAVPPVGITGIGVTDKAVEHDGVICYGAIGVGGTKMKIHKAAVQKLFESNDQVLDTDAIYQIGVALEES